MRLIRARVWLVAALAAIVVLAAAAPSFAVISITSVAVTPSTTEAGAHPDLSIVTSFTGENTQIGGPGRTNPVADSPSIYSLHLGPGLIANPLAAPTCPLATFRADACPPETIVGTSLQRVLVLAAGREFDLPGFIYNLETTSPDQAALLGVRTLTRDPTTGAVVTASLVPFAVTVSPVDLGLDAVNLEPLTAVGRAGPIRITALGLRLNGRAANGFFFSNPTACVPVTVTASAISNAGDRASATVTPYTPTDCGTLAFDAGLGLNLSTTQTDVPVETSVTLTRPDDTDAPRRQSDVLDSTVVLPEGMAVNPALAKGLEACTDEQFAAGDRTTAATCPAASRIGTVRLVTPLLLRTFEGAVYFGPRTSTAFNRLFVDVPLPGARLKLVGQVTLNGSNGQVTTTFQNLPQLPFSSFQLTFQGGDRSVLVTPQSCGTHTATAGLTPYARLTDPTPPNATPSASFTTSFNGAGAPCAAALRPWFTTTPTNLRSGGRTTFRLDFGRGDRDRRIARVTFRLTRGLIGDLALRGLTQCSLADAARGACAASSRIGDATAQVGSGPAPVTVPGDVFLTAPREDGDPAGLSVRIDARIGPIDLGNVIVPVRLVLRSNGGLNAIADLPQFEEGVPVSPRLTTVTITRDGFMRNPTSCGGRRSSGVFEGVGGGSVTTHARFVLQDCRALGFTPRFRIAVGARGKTGAGARPPLTTVITQPEDQSGIARVRVRLPRALPSNSIGLAQACSQADFDASRCSRRARIATARAVSPFVTRSLSGPVWIVKQERKLPKLVVQLRGPLAIDFSGQIKIGGRNRITTIFPTVPDLPVSRFVLQFHAGRFGIIAANTNLCAGRLFAPLQFRAQNGERSNQRPQITVRGCRR
ncbi:MAG TPA: hypothetical protein VKB03_03455 [Conexibacter sp.]|nr:hypothetical protein [Conexibacter sp.]